MLFPASFWLQSTNTRPGRSALGHPVGDPSPGVAGQALGEAAGVRLGLLVRRSPSQRDEDVQPLAAGGLRRTRQAVLGQQRAYPQPHQAGLGQSGRWAGVEVEHQMGRLVERVNQTQEGVDLDRREVGRQTSAATSSRTGVSKVFAVRGKDMVTVGSYGGCGGQRVWKKPGPCTPSGKRRKVTERRARCGSSSGSTRRSSRSTRPSSPRPGPQHPVQAGHAQRAATGVEDDLAGHRPTRPWTISTCCSSWSPSRASSTATASASKACATSTPPWPRTSVGR